VLLLVRIVFQVGCCRIATWRCLRRRPAVFAERGGPAGRFSILCCCVRRGTAGRASSAALQALLDHTIAAAAVRTAAKL